MIIVGEKMNIIPTVLEKTSNHEVAYDLYSRLLEDRILFLSGEINDQTANLIISELLYLDSKSHEDIYMYINSPGGSVTSGMAIYDTMNYIESDIKTICVGIAASMAAFLLSSGTKGKRCALKNADVMIHQPLGGMQGQASDMKIACERILKMKEKLNQILAKNTNQSLSKIKKNTDRDYYLTSDEAQKYGLIDYVIESKI